MKQIAIIIGLICLVAAGCAQITRLAAWDNGESQWVVVWNGRICTKELRTSRQLAQMQRLTRFIARPNAVEMDYVFLEGVEPARMQDLLKRGETIVLPSGRAVAFPPMESKDVDGVVTNGNVQIDSGLSVPFDLKDAEGLAVRYRIDDPKNRRGVDFDFASGGANYK